MFKMQMIYLCNEKYTEDQIRKSLFNTLCSFQHSAFAVEFRDYAGLC